MKCKLRLIVNKNVCPEKHRFIRHVVHIFFLFLQPENILLDDNMNIKVSDFGFATVVMEEEELLGKHVYLVYYYYYYYYTECLVTSLESKI